jgi:hypothetical protein
MDSGQGVMSGIAVLVLPDGRMDAKNAARYCGLSVKTMAMKRCEGTGPRYVKQGRVFYYREHLDAWLKEGLVGSTAQRRSAGGADANAPVNGGRAA